MVALAGAGACVAAGRAMAKAGLGEAPAPKKGGRIRVASLSSSTADTLDPAKGGLSTDYTRHYMIYSGLTQYDGNLQAQPALAESIETADQINWTVKLRKGVAFHDGKSLTADDVVYSLLRHKDPATVSKMQAVAAQFADIRATGPLEVRVSLASANTDLPAILAASHFVIVQDGTQDFRTAVGTGPYKLREFRPGVRTVAVRNENYWRPGKPYVDQIELIGIPDESARVNALLSGDVQLINAVSPLSIRRIDRSPGHAVLQTPSANFTDLIMRQDRLPTSDPDFVMAMKYLFDRELVRKALFRGYARIANDHPIPPDHRFFNADLPQREHDPERARYHLKKAGLMKLRLPVYTSPAATGAVDMASLLQESASRIGFRLAVNRVPADGYWSRHWMKHPLTFGNTNPRPTADLVFSLFFKSDAAWNESGWRNERFDRLLIAARGEPDEAKRKNMYGEMQALVHEKCGVCIPVFIDLIDGYDRRLKGLSPIPSGAFMGYSFAEYVWLDT
ncbi:MAG: ABC transporter substrate-binding protein [Alphaproteobacteria bacterium]|nr:MAG: ABC transporter substrate-binding protein [Alphaproteobacteria bacterium]